jgi:hypothetical protein
MAMEPQYTISKSLPGMRAATQQSTIMHIADMHEARLPLSRP